MPVTCINYTTDTENIYSSFSSIKKIIQISTSNVVQMQSNLYTVVRVNISKIVENRTGEMHYFFVAPMEKPLGIPDIYTFNNFLYMSLKLSIHLNQYMFH